MRVCLVLLASLVACGGAEDDLIAFDRPQIVPESNVRCLSYNPVEAGSATFHDLQLTNRGRAPLRIEGAAVERDDRSAFDIVQLRSVEGSPCTEAAPCSIRSAEDAFLRFRYRPPAAGWDAADLRVFSNAENFPRLRIFVLALAYPPGEADAFDPGPKPDVAVGADGSETCP